MTANPSFMGSILFKGSSEYNPLCTGTSSPLLTSLLMAVYRVFLFSTPQITARSPVWNSSLPLLVSSVILYIFVQNNLSWVACQELRHLFKDFDAVGERRMSIKHICKPAAG